MLSRCYPPISLLQALEDYFGCEVTKASFYETDCDDPLVPCAWAKGDFVVLPRGTVSDLGPNGIYLLSHEVCHLRQQAEKHVFNPKMNEIEADLHAGLFTVGFYKGALHPRKGRILPLTKSEQTCSMAWGLGGLFSLKQLIVDRYAKEKGYAYFYEGPHEWLTKTAYLNNSIYFDDFVTRQEEFNVDEIILGSEMNDMFFLPDAIKDGDVLKKFDELLKQNAEDFDVKDIADTIGVVFEDKSNPINKENMTFGVSLMAHIIRQWLGIDAFISLINRTKEQFNDSTDKDKFNFREKIKEYKKDIVKDIHTILPDFLIDGPKSAFNAIMKFSLLSFFTYNPIAYLASLIFSIIPNLLLDDFLNKNEFDDLNPKDAAKYKEIKEEFEKRKKEIMKDVKGTQQNVAYTLILMDIWWKGYSEALRDLEAKNVYNLRKLYAWIKDFDDTKVSFSEEIENIFKTISLEDIIKDTVGNVNIKNPLFACSSNDLKLNCTLSLFNYKGEATNLELDFSNVDKSKNNMYDNVYKPFFDKAESIINDSLKKIINCLKGIIEKVLGLYKTSVFLLGSHTGQLQFLHSMDCSHGCNEWNREKIIRWCKFCFDTLEKNKEKKALLDKNIYIYFDSLLPELKTDSVEKDKSGSNQNIIFGNELPNVVLENYKHYSDWAEKHNDDLLLASMLFPLCSIKLEMNNCHLAAEQVSKKICGLEEDQKATLEQAKCFDICLVIALKHSLSKINEGGDSNELSRIQGLYRSPIADVTFRELFSNNNKHKASEIILGMTMHMIEDGFTPSHTVRTWNCNPGKSVSSIITFADYTKQDSSRHACADYFQYATEEFEFGDDDMPMELDSDNNLFNINIDTEKKKSINKTLLSNIPAYSAKVTVGAECALTYASAVFRYITKDKEFSSEKIKSIYPFYDKKKTLPKSILDNKVLNFDYAALDTSPSGRCYESPEYKSKTFFEQRLDSFINSSLGEERSTKDDERIEKLERTITEYRKYLLLHFAPNRYPDRTIIDYYKKWSEKEDGFWDRLIQIPKSYKKQYDKGVVNKNVELVSGKVVSETSRRVLYMYYHNDLQFLYDILTSPLLRKNVKETYETYIGTSIENTSITHDHAKKIAKFIKNTHQRYILHLNEIIMNADCIYTQAANPEDKKLAKIVIESAISILEIADDLWNNFTGESKGSFFARITKMIKDQMEKRIVLTYLFTDDVFFNTWSEYVIKLMKEKEIEDFQLEASNLMEDLLSVVSKYPECSQIVNEIDEVFKKYQWLRTACDSFTLNNDKERFCDHLARLFISIKAFLRKQSFDDSSVPKDIRELLEEMKNKDIPLFEERRLSNNTAVQEENLNNTNETGSIVSYLVNALNYVKNHGNSSVYAANEFGDDYSSDIIQKIGANFRLLLS